MARVAFLGPSGTFAEEALLSQPDLADEEPLPERTVPDVIDAVESGRADLGVVPIENSIEGSVNVTLDTLAFDTGLLVQREIVLPVSLNLLARPDVRLSEVTRVMSHPHANAQCRGWLARKLPEAEAEAANSTAEAVARVARSKRKGLAAIGTRHAGDLHGLDVLAEEIEDHPENKTRFVVVGHGVPAPSGHDKTSIVCFQRQDRPGSLLAILQEFAARSVNLTKLESRPTKQALGDYCFFIDLEGHVSDEVTADALRNLRAKLADVKFLGSYPMGESEQAQGRRTRASKAWRDASGWLERIRSQIRTVPG